MQRQPRSPLMVAAGRVEQQHIRWRRQRPIVASISRPILSAISPGLYGASATPRRTFTRSVHLAYLAASL